MVEQGNFTEQPHQENQLPSLTPQNRVDIYDAIYQNMAPDDRHPYEVITDTFGGDEEAYLRTMAGWHQVSLDK